MWNIEGVELSEDVNRRLREYIITQMLNFLQFLLAVNDISDSGTTTFDEICEAERIKFINTPSYEDDNEYEHGENYDDGSVIEKYIPNFKCLWDIIFNKFGQDNPHPYTPILSAYCRSNNITKKQTLYIHMAEELDQWVKTITRLDDIVIIAIGMVKNTDIYHIFEIYKRIQEKHGETKLFYGNALHRLIKNNFENINPYSYYVCSISQKTYDDPLQQVFVEFINNSVNSKFSTGPWTKKYICDLVATIIYHTFDITIPIHPTETEIIDDTEFYHIPQIIEYCESKIPQYPAEIKPHLSILQVIDVYCFDEIFDKLAKMAELSNYNLRNLPITAIINGDCGAIPIDEIPNIPEYYARLTQSYSGLRTKAANREI